MLPCAVQLTMRGACTGRQGLGPLAPQGLTQIMLSLGRELAWRHQQRALDSAIGKVAALSPGMTEAGKR